MKMPSRFLLVILILFVPVISHSQGMPDRQFQRLLNRGEPEEQLRVGLELHEGTSSDFGKNEAQGRQLIETVANLETNSRVRVRAVSALLETYVRNGNFDAADQLLLKEEGVNTGAIFPFAGQKFLEANELHRAEDVFIKAFRASGITSEMKMRIAEQLSALYSNPEAGTLLDYEQGFEWAKRAVELGSTYALGYLGYAYQTGQGVAKDEAISFSYWIRAAEKGNRRAMFQTAYSYFAMAGVPINFDLGREWLEKAILAREPLSFFFKGQAIYSGDYGYAVDAKAAIHLMVESYFEGYSPALDTVYDLASNGVKEAQDHIVFLREERAEWLSSSQVNAWALDYDYSNINYGTVPARFVINEARSGNSVAQNFIGNMLYNEEISGQFSYAIDELTKQGLAADEHSYISWFEKSAANGSSDSNHALGLIYSDGIYTQKNLITALGYFLRAYQQGDSRSSRTIMQILRANEVDFGNENADFLSALLNYLDSNPELTAAERDTLKGQFITNSVATPVPASDDLSEKLRDLGNLYQEGLLSDEEFEAAKKLLLGL
jgi:TPR repeat protein